MSSREVHESSTSKIFFLGMVTPGVRQDASALLGPRRCASLCLPLFELVIGKEEATPGRARLNAETQLFGASGPDRMRRSGPASRPAVTDSRDRRRALPTDLRDRP